MFGEDFIGSDSSEFLVSEACLIVAKLEEEVFIGKEKEEQLFIITILHIEQFLKNLKAGSGVFLFHVTLIRSEMRFPFNRENSCFQNPAFVKKPYQGR